MSHLWLLNGHLSWVANKCPPLQKGAFLAKLRVLVYGSKHKHLEGSLTTCLLNQTPVEGYKIKEVNDYYHSMVNKCFFKYYSI